MVTTQDAHKTLERAIMRYRGLHAEEDTLLMKKKFEVRQATVQILDEHLQSVEISNGVVTVSIDLKLQEILRQLRSLKFNIGLFGLRRYLTELSKETNLQYKLKDYQTRLYANR